ncbi:XAC0095 family protein [Xanthomonas vasicola]|uniref:XAC0095 family protein n=1 Tax=Xanthomonas vasicola TaxID=56459 RepID=UPI0002F4A264|nr:hypothetical protein [Xanthomonas vasicola]KFA39283.1 hypothetical protein KWS_0104310 [Xanthomonas vasicola pv. musacearum NCPPB 4384]AZR32993.1 hypothetical protein KWO_016115 [Xanthomonas vasicola pv. musacearum NCPPB 4379]KFA08009.1 hypothetical protein KWM_0113900 [Xanthomonas vasicola pv. musacearum NCPPB 2005]KFA14916.1 hypothetical protein KWQ_0103140 [Xanthomonas vasicola pv. musacearum NCPPB 4380]KFA16846.1 hypothetical protein A11G_0116700 [Xanthomonas vasicola pv. musacearum NCP
MSDVVREVQSQPGYYLPEGAQYRLQQLRDHMRFLARVAQPRTQAEERARQPDICMDELAVCLELLAEQLGGVLDDVECAVMEGTHPQPWRVVPSESC